VVDVADVKSWHRCVVDSCRVVELEWIPCVASTWQQVHVAASTKERWKGGEDDFGEIFDGYVLNLMMLLSIRNSSHWYGGRYVQK